MQVHQSSQHIQSFGGINFLYETLKQTGFHRQVQEQLGSRTPGAQYRYSDILQQLFFIVSIGGDCLDDTLTLQQQLQDHPHLRIASADTIEYAFQELRQKNIIQQTANDITHTINEHEKFNQLLPRLCMASGLLNSEKAYVMDYDGHIVKNTKPDNAFTYKKNEGYYPVLGSINKLPVYMQNRNGNTPENYQLLPVVQKAMETCHTENIQVSCLRGDASCYQADLIHYLDAQQKGYCIRAEMNEGLHIALQDERDWQAIILNHQKLEVCSITENIFGVQRRIVGYRKKVTGQLKMHQADGYDYHAILTSDKSSNAKSIIEFYNQRGCQGEHHFKELDYDFCWRKLPFDNMEMNTIYMYSMLVAYVLFNAAKKAYAPKLKEVNTSMQLKNFILHFVTLPAKWIYKGRQWILKIFTLKDYSAVLQT